MKYLSGISIPLTIFFAGLICPLQPSISDVFAQTKIRIATGGPSLSYFPVYVALQKGLFKKYGIDAELIQMGSGPIVTSALLNGEVNYATTVGPVAAAAVRGAPLKIVCFTSVKLQNWIVSRAEIRSPKDLAGKRIGIGQLRDLTWYEVQFVIEKYGLRDVTIVPLGQAQRGMAAMQSGALDAAIIPVPIDLKAEEMGLRRLIRMGEILPVPQVGLGSSDEGIKRREEVDRVLKATIEGLGYVRNKSNRQDVVAMIGRWINLSASQAEKAFGAVEDTFSSNCIPTPDQASAYLAMLKITTDSKDSISPATVFHFSRAEEVSKALLTQK